MTTTKHETGSALAIRDDQQGFTPQQVATLKQLGLDEATDGDLEVFFHQCQRTGLDPFARQVYMVGRWDSRSRAKKYTIQTGIDGFRLIGRRVADARRETLEITDTEWCGPDGRWTDVWLKPEPPAAARVAIIRNGGRFPAVALFHEYAQTTKDGGLTPMWQSKGALMIAKCAEALAWRKAFPQDLSGIYTSDEMQQADNHVTVQQTPKPKPPTAQQIMREDGITHEQTQKLAGLLKDQGINRDEALSFAIGVVGRELKSAAALTRDEADKVIEALTTGEVVEGEVIDDSAEEAQQAFESERPDQAEPEGW